MDELFTKDLETPFTTPDLCVLENRNMHLLLGCTVKKSANALCSAYTVERMSLFIRREDHLPLPVKIQFMSKARIGGCLYKLTTEEMVELDNLKQNRLSFERKQIEVYVPSVDKNGDREYKVLDAPVWFYSVIPDVWEERIERCQRKYNIVPSNPEIVLANRYVDNTSLLNNHFRSSSKRIEEYYDQPKPVVATPEVIAHVRWKNDLEIKRLKSFWNRR